VGELHAADAVTAPRDGSAAPDSFFRKVVEGMRCAIITVDRAGRVLTVNQLAREILELPADAPSGRPVEEVFAAHPRLAAVLRDSLEMTFLPNRAEMEIRSREDDGRTIGFTISPIPGDGGPEGVALFFKDLTLVERQEEQERLRDRLAALGQMAASLAHEIRNPLASIDVTATLLLRKLGDGNGVQELVEKIAEDVKRLNRTVTGGLEFARALTLEKAPQPLPPLLDAALEEARHRFPGGAVEIERAYAPGLPDAEVDGHLLRQALVNVIANALEALGGQGRLKLAARATERPGREPVAIDLLIQDDGPGIPAEVREKIFHPFVTTKKGGSGIGLAMARKIVECHHGLIDVCSTPGEGTAFRIRIPCRENQP
jgi:PAS domain S-box-containing protein